MQPGFNRFGRLELTMSVYKINMTDYPRRNHFDYFRSLQYPYVGVTVNIDIASILRFTKETGHSFYLTFMHAVALAADRIPEFRQRIRENQIIEYSECPTSHTERFNNSVYCYCTLHHHMGLQEYYTLAEKARKNCFQNGIQEDEDVECMYFISTLPWFHYSALIQPVACGDESNPRFTWGKYERKENGSILMPVSVLAHHALVDGIHIAQFYENLETEIHKLAL